MQLEIAKRIVDSMMQKDTFSQWLGIRIVDVQPGSCIIEMDVRADMLNGFGIGHGGIAFSLADSALAFAANTHGRVSLALNNNMTYSAPVREGDTLTATCREIATSRKTGTYDVEITDQDARTVGLFRGTVYRKNEDHPVLNEK